MELTKCSLCYMMCRCGARPNDMIRRYVCCTCRHVKPAIAVVRPRNAVGGRSRACACAQRTGLFGRGQSCSIATRRFAENLQMSGIARASLSNGKKSASVLELARTRGSGPRTDPSGREARKDRSLLERLEAENRELRNQAIQLA